MQELDIGTVVKVADNDFVEAFGPIGNITEVNSSLCYVVPADIKGKDGMWIKADQLSVYDAEAEAAAEEERKAQEGDGDEDNS